LTIARAAADAFRLARVLFIPAANPPHKQTGELSSYEDRFRMVELACAADARFEPSRLEEGAAKSYSIHTIERVRAAEPNSDLHFLIGADAFAEIGTWFRWRDVLAAVTFIVVSRPGAAYEVPPQARVFRLEQIDMPVSSSEIRRLLKNGSIDAPVPPSVATYIQEHELYR
jgi:nicotinate-nucleotide adenylyltransferase